MRAQKLLVRRTPAPLALIHMRFEQDRDIHFDQLDVLPTVVLNVESFPMDLHLRNPFVNSETYEFGNIVELSLLVPQMVFHVPDLVERRIPKENDSTSMHIYMIS